MEDILKNENDVTESNVEVIAPSTIIDQNLGDNIPVPVPNVVDGEIVSEVPIEVQEEIVNIKLTSISPLTILENNINGTNVATCVYICIDSESKVFILLKNYVLNNDSLEFIKTVEFHSDNAFISDKICADILMNNLDCYVSDFEFSVDEDFAVNEDPYVKLVAARTKSPHVKNIEIEFSANAFAAIATIDSFILNNSYNSYDLSLATIAGSKYIDKPATFFVIDDIIDIVSIAQADTRKGIDKLFKKNESTSIGVVFRAMKFTNNDRDIIQVLSPFDIGFKIDKKKSKNNTIEDIENKYYGDADQFVTTLLIENIRLHGVDKEYMLIRGKNKDGDIKIILLDSAMKDKLTSLIEAY